jgi:hypothetical protein
MQKHILQADTKHLLGAIKTHLEQTANTRRRDFTVSRIMKTQPQQSKS